MVAPRALEGILVLDLSRILAGPFATMMLGDMGAVVIKVEEPNHGDDSRGFGPPFLDGESTYFLSVNRNKRSLVVDLKSDEGKDIVKRLARKADVVVENFRPGTAERMGLGYADLSTDNAGLVYVSVSGFGQTGPERTRPGYDVLAQGMGGIMSLTGVPDGEPMKVGVGIADVMTGMYATVGILAALQHRQRTGQGQHIDISLLDTQISWLVNAGTNYLTDRQLPTRLGNGHPNIVPYQVFSTADSPMILAVGNDAQFRRFCEVAGIDEVASDERYATNPMRIRNRVALCELVGNALGTRPRATWLRELEAVGVPCGPVNNLEDVFADPHVKARGAELRMPCEWAAGGEIGLLANPLRMTATPPSYRRPPPRLNEHAAEVLADWLGNNATH